MRGGSKSLGVDHDGGDESRAPMCDVLPAKPSVQLALHVGDHLVAAPRLRYSRRSGRSSCCVYSASGPWFQRFATHLNESVIGRRTYAISLGG